MRFLALFVSMGLGLFLAACSPATDISESTQPIQIPHIHGLGFSAEDSALYVPAHTGLIVYANGGWNVPDLPVNDYMGYTPTDQGFYSSGHPGVNSNLPNPLGIVKSEDEGRTLQTLAFQGEIDFHQLGVGYKNYAIYALNETPNTQIGIGLFYSLDDGVTWEQSAGGGVRGQILQIAVHPTKAEIVALATENGLYLSSDYGSTFDPVGTSAPISSVTFDPAGDQLLFGYQELSTYTLESRQIQILASPTLTQDTAISYIAVDPKSNTLALATFAKDIYLSQDGGVSWRVIASQGLTQSAR